MNEDPQPPGIVRLHARDLLSKWGFEDGGLLDWVCDFGPYDPHAVLHLVVKRKLVKKLRHKIELCFIETPHNPVRALRFDRSDAECYWHRAELPFTFRPDFVDVSGAEILRLAKETLR